MTHAATSPIPVLKPGITITPYEQAAGETAPRFLLALGASYFLVSLNTRALVMALLHNPPTLVQLEEEFKAASGTHLPAAHLLKLAQQHLPSVLLRDTPMPPRELPFILSLTLLGPQLAARVTAHLTWLFKPYLAAILIATFILLHIASLPAAMHLAHADWTAKESIALAVLFLLSGLIHELGHTTACRSFACPHGGIGVGLYYIFPAWYADVTNAWQLPRRQRAVVDLGGVYFQSIMLIAIDAYALASGNPLALKLVWLITFAMLFTLNPVFKFDGYWLLSDLSGLHNLHKKVRDATAALVATAMGRRSVSAPGVRSSILTAYSVLSLCYFVYFGLFLARELVALSTTMVPAVSARWQLLAAIDLTQGWEVTLAAGRLVAALAWPLMIALATVFFLNRLRRAVVGIIASIRDARMLPPLSKLV